MGADIHVFVEAKIKDKWELVECLQPFRYRDYSVFGWLAGVRNYSAVRPMFQCRGVPSDFSLTDDYYEFYHSMTWFTVDELLAVNYDGLVEDRRTEVQFGNRVTDGGFTAPDGKMMPLAEFLGKQFMISLAVCKAVQKELGKLRITIGFDS